RIVTVEKLATALEISSGWLAFGLAGPVPRQQAAGHPGLAARLKQIRAAYGLSRAALSQAAVVPVGSLQHIEEGGGAARADALERLGVALDVSPAWLAFGEGGTPTGLELPVAPV